MVGYLLGSFNFAVHIAKFHRVDIFNEGSCNPGATNVKRVIGACAGNAVFVLDTLKGIIASSWFLFVLEPESYNCMLLGFFGLVGAVIGHSYSCFHRFRGGKGVATTMGGLFVLMPIALIIGILAWLISYYATRVVAIASLVFALSLPLSAYFFESSSNLSFVLGFLIALLIIYRHLPNIKRLLHGGENSFKK